MITISLAKTSLFETTADAYVFLVEEGFTFSPELERFSEHYFPPLRSLMQERNFLGKLLSTLTIPVNYSGRITYVVFIGLGMRQHKPFDIEVLRRVVGSMIRVAEQIRVSSIALEVPAAHTFGVSLEDTVKELTTTAMMASYQFDLFFTDETAKISRDLVIHLVASAKEHETLQRGITKGSLIGQAVNSARTWVDMPPSVLHPTQLADYAREIAKQQNLKITVFHEQQIIEMGMGGLAGVSRGSDHDSQFVIMEYKTSKPHAPTIAFVGKGITFDSGGLSIKPANAMEDMKEDMSGAAAVIASMSAIGQLKPEVNIVALTPICENLPSGKATKPGDILRFYNGKTAEVRNTDAEGRLILADALSYAVQHYKPDFIIDLATLTGACSYALGPFFSGMMGKHEDYMHKVEKAGQRSGDHVWRLPFTDDYKVAIKSAVADICNIGSSKYRAGAITAGFFLSNFVSDTPWVHLDIAGTAFDVPDIPYYRPGGATGVGVRLLVDLAMHWQ
jgi:leucyl aminopeptidase